MTMSSLSPPSVPQTSLIPEAEMKKTHSGLAKAMEDFLVELKSRQEQQRVEDEEAAKMKKIREEQVLQWWA